MSWIFRNIFLVLTLVLIACGSGGGESHHSARQAIEYSIAFDNNQLADIYLPSSEKQLTTSVLLVHGGGWSGGDKADMQGIARYLSGSGFPVLVPNYRLAQADINHFPAQLEDMQFALLWLRANAEALRLNLEKVCVIGYSAGAHLAVLLGAGDTRPELNVDCVAAISGVYDLTAKDFDPQTQALIKQIFPQDLQRLASPVFNLSPTSAQLLIIHGSEDSLFPQSQALALNQRAVSLGIPVELLILEGEGHLNFSAHGETLMLQALMKFLTD